MATGELELIPEAPQFERASAQGEPGAVGALEKAGQLCRCDGHFPSIRVATGVLAFR
jgi:hypothetical protein